MPEMLEEDGGEMKYEVGKNYLVWGNNLMLVGRIPCRKRKQDNHQAYCKGLLDFCGDEAFCGYSEAKPLYKPIKEATP